jgi:S-adenosylmethionine-diacylglycerol 3-amino-3-carboxypropyl transferase
MMQDASVVAHRVDVRSPHPVHRPCERRRLGSAVSDQLYFAQVHEDPMLELEALAAKPGERVVMVSSGGCTLLSLLGSARVHVTGVDLNVTQNTLVELKRAAVLAMDAAEATAFLGGTPQASAVRAQHYKHRVRDLLTPEARRYWDSHPQMIRKGVLDAGKSERFVRLLVSVIKTFIVPSARIERILDCRTLEDQRTFFATEWDSWRWRLWLRALYNRFIFGKGLDPRFFEHVEASSYADMFYALSKRALTELPIQDNYFFHHMFLEYYPTDVPSGVPPYLSAAGVEGQRANAGNLTLIDGAFTDCLRELPPRSVHGFSLSNICEWLSTGEIEALFDEIIRTGVHGARVCYRNWVGSTQLPRSAVDRIIEDPALGSSLIRKDRSMNQPRFVAAKVLHKDAWA